MLKIMSSLKLSPIQWKLNGERVRGAQLSRGRPLSGAPPSLTPRLRSALRDQREKRSHSHYKLTPPVTDLRVQYSCASRPSLVERSVRLSRHSARLTSHVVKWNCQTWYTFAYRCYTVSVDYYTFYSLTCGCLCYRSGAIILENWIIRTYNGLSQVSYFGCWSQRGTSLFYHVHRRTFRRLGRYMFKNTHVFTTSWFNRQRTCFMYDFFYWHWITLFMVCVFVVFGS